MKGFWILLLSLPLLCYSQIYPAHKPEKPLQSLSIAEVNALFDDANQIYKSRDMARLLDDLSEKLNGVAMVALNDRVVAQRASGYRKMTHRSSSMRISDTTCFELASVSKQFTATAILQLVEQEKLFLDDQLTDFFPNLPYRNITIRHLLTHTSGLPEFFKFDPRWYGVDRMLTYHDVVRVMAARRPAMAFNTGESFKYTNTNYLLLAAIVEKVSGVKFEEYLQKNIFQPAGMAHTFCVTQLSQRTNEPIAWGHRNSNKPLAISFDDGTIGEKGIYSSLHDLILWKKAFFHDYAVLSEAWVDAAIQPENLLNNETFPEELYGYGFRIEENPFYGRLVYHGGLWHGFQHLFLYYPEKNIFMVFLSNHHNGAHRGKSAEVLKILCGI